MQGCQKGHRLISLGLADELVEEGQHICYIYRDEAERRQTMARFIHSGLLANEKVLYLADIMSPAEMVSALEEQGIAVSDYPLSVDIRSAESVYLSSGRFSIDDMLAATQQFYHQAVDQEHHAGARGAGEMSWYARDGNADGQDLLEYEARLNRFIPETPYTACCQYDAHLFSGEILMSILALHPVAIVRGQLVQNPFYGA